MIVTLQPAAAIMEVPEIRYLRRTPGGYSVQDKFQHATHFTKDEAEKAVAWAKNESWSIRFKIEVVHTFVAVDKEGGGFVCYNGIEGWHFTTISNNAKHFMSRGLAEEVINEHFRGNMLSTIEL